VTTRARRALAVIGSIPKGFPCRPACGACCKTAITMLKVEWQRLKRKLESIAPESPDRKVYELSSKHPDEQDTVLVIDERGWCPFLGEDGFTCQTYDDRPVVCSVYGQHYSMYCSEGVVCPPELEVPLEAIEEFAKLMGARPGGFVVTEEDQTRVRAYTLWWRETYKKRPDQAPRHPEDAESYAVWCALQSRENVDPVKVN